MQQLTILLDSGERKTVVLSKSEFFELPSDQSKIFPEVYFPFQALLGGGVVTDAVAYQNEFLAAQIVQFHD